MAKQTNSLNELKRTRRMRAQKAKLCRRCMAVVWHDEVKGVRVVNDTDGNPHSLTCEKPPNPYAGMSKQKVRNKTHGSLFDG